MATHQTVRLSRGAHASPDQGVCVMELASMLAGERFTDRPRSVSPLLTVLLRDYNDRIDDDRRQDLYAYASRAVGSRGSRAIERRRAERTLEWAIEQGARLSWLARRFPGASVGVVAAQIAAADTGDESHRRILALVEELIDCGQEGVQKELTPPHELVARAG